MYTRVQGCTRQTVNTKENQTSQDTKGGISEAVVPSLTLTKGCALAQPASLGVFDFNRLPSLCWLWSPWGTCTRSTTDRKEMEKYTHVHNEKRKARQGGGEERGNHVVQSLSSPTREASENLLFAL